MKIYKIQLLVFLLSISSLIFGQQTDEEIRQLMWHSGDADFERNEIPEKWKDESAVILCKSAQYEFRKQVLAARVNNDYYFRQRIKLLDKSAVDEFSEFTFKELNRYKASRDGIFLGVKIIKPDGTEREINIDEAVKVQKYTSSRENRSLNQGYNKLAIPDLEIGDIIDYYYVFINTISTQNTGNRFEFNPEFIILTNQFPIIKGKLGFLTERKCYINLSVSNGTPQPIKSIKDEKDYYVIEYENLEKYKTELWTSPFRQYPTVKVQVIIAPKQVSSLEKQFLGKPEIPKFSATGEDYMRLLKLMSFSPDLNPPLKVAGSKFLRKQRISKNPETLAEDLFYYYRHFLFFNHYYFYGQTYANRYRYNNVDFVQAFSMLLKKYNIDHELFLGVPKDIGVIDSVVMLYEITPFIRINTNNSKPIYIREPGGYTVFGENDYRLEGTKTIGTMVLANQRMPMLIHDSVASAICTDHYQFDSIHVQFDKQNHEQLQISQNYVSRGFLKEFFSYMVLTPKDYYNEEYNHLKKIYKFKAKELVEIDELLESIDNQYEKDSTERIDEIEQWLKESHMVSDISINKLNVIQQGRFSATADLIFNCEMQTSDLVKNAGNYLVLEIGKIIGRNIDLTPKEKEREYDIYMACPRQYDWLMRVDIPEGYTIDNVSDLNYSIQNSTGGFSSIATIEGSQVRLEVTKYYNHSYEPLTNWPEMLDFIEIANEFVQQKIVFKKVE